MKVYLPLFALLLLGLWSCTPSTLRDIPEDENLRPFLYDYQLIQQTSFSSLPVFNRTQLIYKDEAGGDISFLAKAPVYVEFFSEKKTYPDPTNEFDGVEYSYTVDKHQLEFLSATHGILLQFEIFPSICEDPKLEENDVLKDQIFVSIYGFLPNGQNPIPSPLLSFSTSTQIICMDDPNVSKRRISQLELNDKIFEDVLYVSHDLGENTFEIFYNDTWGLVAFRYGDIFWVIDQII